MSRFASLTANLLVRKNGAVPSTFGIESSTVALFGRSNGELPAAAVSAASLLNPSENRTAGPPHEHSGKTLVQSLHVQRSDCEIILSLKPSHFVKLSLAAALLRRSMTDIVYEALDQWLGEFPGDVFSHCACMHVSDDSRVIGRP